MALPSSSKWTIFDFDPTSINTILGYPESTIIGGPGDVTITSDLLQIYSDGTESSLLMDVGVPGKFSVDLSFRGDALPTDLTSLTTKRVYISVYDQQSYAAGILLSQAGIAYVADISGIGSVSPIPGSASLVQNNVWYRLRLVLDGDNKLLYVYLTEEADLGTHQLRYVLNTEVSPSATDTCKIEVFGEALDPTQITVQLYKLSSRLVLANRPPIAVTGDDRSVIVGDYITLDGRGSYDPEGADLTYKWRQLSAPGDSQYIHSGVSGTTPSEGDPSGYTSLFRCEAGFGDTVSPFDLLVVDDVVATISPDCFSGGDLIDHKLLKLTEQVFVEGQTGLSWSILYQTGIGDLTSSLTYGHLDVKGLYTFGLTVNDGEFDSLETHLIIQALDTHLVTSQLPDMSYLWKCLGDEWDFVDDYDLIENIWSAYALVIAGYLYWAWQVQSCRSLARTPKKLVRKWACYPTRIDKGKWDSETYHDFHPPIVTSYTPVSVDGLTLKIVVQGEEYTITLVGTPSPTILSQQINGGLPVQIATVVNSKLAFQGSVYWEILADGTANSVLGLSTTQNTKCYLNGSLAQPRQYPGREGLKGFISKLQQLVYVYHIHIGHAWAHVNPDIANTVTSTLNPLSTIDEIYDYLNELISCYNDHDSNVDGGGITAYHNDLGRHQISGTATDWASAIDLYNEFLLIFDEHRVDVHTYHLIEVSPTLPAEEPEFSLGPEELRTIIINDPVYFIDTDLSNKIILIGTEIYVIESVISSNRLRLKTPISADGIYNWSIKPLFKFDGIDFSEIRLCNWDSIKINVTPDEGDTEIVLVDTDGGIGEHGTWDPTFLAYYSGAVHALSIIKRQYLPLYEDTISIPFLSTGFGQTTYYEGKDYVVDDVWLKFLRYIEPPDVWIAEYTVFNNTTIEENFGSLISVEEADVKGDYLSSIRALFYSYWWGAKLDALRLGTHVLMGLPLVEAPGTIIDVLPVFSSTHGRILIESDGYVYTYYYPRQAEIADNPATNEPYKLGDDVKAFAQLCTGVNVTDYIEGNWYSNYVEQGVISSLQKYHTFYIEVDLGVFDIEQLALIRNFIYRIKAARTNCLLAPYKSINDGIDINDILQRIANIHYYENIKSFSDGGSRKADDWDSTGHRGTSDSSERIGADSILPGGIRDHVWQLLEPGTTYSEFEVLVIALKRAINRHISNTPNNYHGVVDTVNEIINEVSGGLFYLNETLYECQERFNLHLQNWGGSYHSAVGTHISSMTKPYNMATAIQFYITLKTNLNAHLTDAIHSALDSDNDIATTDPFLHDASLPVEPPFIMGRDWSGYSGNITELNTTSLILNVTDGRMCPYLKSLILFEETNNQLTYNRDNTLVIPTTDNSVAETTNPWGGDRSIQLTGSNVIIWDSASFSIAEKGTILFKFKPNADLLNAATVNPVHFLAVLGNFGSDNNKIEISLLQGGTGLITDIRAILYDSAGVIISSMTAPFSLADPWYEICYQWHAVAGYEALFIDGVEIDSDTATGTRTLTTLSLGFGASFNMFIPAASSYYLDNVALYDEVIHEDGYVPQMVETYHDPGEVTINFGLGTKQDAIDAINNELNNVAHLYSYNAGEYPLLLSWNRRIEVIGGDAASIFGFPISVEKQRCKYSIIGTDLTGGLNVTGLTFDFTLDGTDYSVTFSGPDPISGSGIINQINNVAGCELARFDGAYLKLGSAHLLIIGSGDANSVLGFDDHASTLMDTWADIRPEMYIEATFCEDYGSGMSHAEVIDALNTLGSNFEDHISDTPDTYHMNPDTFNTLNPLYYPLTHASTMTNAINFINNFKLCFNSHDNNSGDLFHGVWGSFQVAVADAVDWDTLVVLYADIVSKYNAHIIEV